MYRLNVTYTSHSGTESEPVNVPTNVTSPRLLRVIPEEELNEELLNRVSIEELDQRRLRALGK